MSTTRIGQNIFQSRKDSKHFAAMLESIESEADKSAFSEAVKAYFWEKNLSDNASFKSYKINTQELNTIAQSIF